MMDATTALIAAGLAGTATLAAAGLGAVRMAGALVRRVRAPKAARPLTGADVSRMLSEGGGRVQRPPLKTYKRSNMGNMPVAYLVMTPRDISRLADDFCRKDRNDDPATAPVRCFREGVSAESHSP